MSSLAYNKREGFMDFGGITVLLAVLYNAILAIANAHIMTVSPAMVAFSEAIIVVASLSYIALRIRALPNILPPLLFMLAFVMFFAIVSIVNETFFLKALRDMLLIVTFFLMGGLIGEKSLINVFKILGWLVLAFILVENYATETYTSLFKPAEYYANTRGQAEVEFNELGVFNAALGYADRFSFNISNHRLSSVFLEQVSLGNFSLILSIFLATFWDRLKKFDRLFFFILIPLIIMTTDSRAASAISLIILFGFFIFPHLPRYVNLAYMPLALLIGAVFFYDPNTYVFTDDLEGRIGNTINFFAHMDMGYFAGGNLAQIGKTWDSGYAYMIYTLTVFGLIALWVFSSFIVPQDSAASKRYVHSANIFLFISLMVSGAVFSIKVAALLWLMAGFLYYKQYQNQEGGSR